MPALGSSCKYRLTLAERFDYTETIINQLLADLYQDPISEWQVTIKLHLLAGFKSESDTYFSFAWPTHYFIYHFLCDSFLHSVTVLVSPQAKPSQNK